MGTPEFAVPSLEALLHHDYLVPVVVTSPDKPAGRGRKIKASPVKEYALKNRLNILQPKNLKDPVFISELEKLGINLIVVVAFRMLPEAVWRFPEYGTFNLHASLLPRYRGAAPINWAIINGEKTTGLTTFFIDEKIDTGNIILQEQVQIRDHDTAGDLHDRMMEQGAALVIETVKLIEQNTAKTKRQDQLVSKPDQLKPAPKLQREDLKIDWAQDVNSIYNFIRGLSPYPAAFSSLVSPEGKKYHLKILYGKPVEDCRLAPAHIATNNKSFIKVGCNPGCLEITHLQLAGKKPLPVKEFLKGFQLSGNWKLS